MKVEEISARQAVVTFDGPLTLGMSLRLADSQLRALIDKGVCELVLDLTAVPYCDSSGLGAIVLAFGLAKQGGGMLRMCGLSGRVLSMFQMTSTDQLIPIDADRAASLAAFG
jgi:anti-sigma B factor antagonist